MFRRPVLRTLTVLVVSLALATPLCEAASRSSAPGRASRTSPASTPLLDPLLGAWDWVTSLWTKNGCSLDPGGACAPGPTGPPLAPGVSESSTDAGCGIDPGGRTTCGGHS